MYCKYCGNQIEENKNFCKYCGKRLVFEKNEKIIEIDQKSDKGENLKESDTIVSDKEKNLKESDTIVSDKEKNLKESDTIVSDKEENLKESDTIVSDKEENLNESDTISLEKFSVKKIVFIILIYLFIIVISGLFFIPFKPYAFNTSTDHYGEITYINNSNKEYHHVFDVPESGGDIFVKTEGHDYGEMAELRYGVVWGEMLLRLVLITIPFVIYIIIYKKGKFLNKGF